MVNSGKILLSFKSVSKYYKQFRALNNVSFEINKGEIFGYIGRNGAGKTTTIKIMTGLLQKFSGNYSLNGYKLPEEMSKVREMFGFMPQSVGFQDWRTTEHALRTFGQLSGMSGKALEYRIGEVLDLLKISQFRRKKIKELSGGTIQKVGIAQAILHRPELLILDEPLSGLDPESRYNLKDIIRTVRNEGTTIFFSSHILSDVEDLADRIGIIDGGEILTRGSLSELKEELGAVTGIEIFLIDNKASLDFLMDNKDIKNITTTNNGKYILEVDKEADLDLLSQNTIKELISKDIKVRAFQPVSPNLDDIFMLYVKQNKKNQKENFALSAMEGD